MPTFAIRNEYQLQGKVLEWLKRHAWKACNRQKRFVGSNPILSAKKLRLSPIYTGFPRAMKY